MGEVPVSAVLLDVGGVFHVPNPKHLGEALGREVTLDAAIEAHYRAVAAMTEFAEGDDAVWRAYAETFAATIDASTALDALLAAFDTPAVWSGIIPGSFDALRELARLGVDLAIVSNSDGTLEGRLRAEGLCQVGAGDGVCVAVVCDSRACGVAKPDPVIFHLALDALGVEPEAAVHVGDTYGADVVGAHAAGVRAIHVDPLGLCRHGNDHVDVTSLADVVAWVQASAL
jgi:putative hydrolase of the HAD superfamily